MDDENTFKINSVAASGLVSSSVLAALVGALGAKGVLSDDDVHDIYDEALLSLEAQQAQSDTPEMDEVYEAARRIIEMPLRELEQKCRRG